MQNPVQKDAAFAERLRRLEFNKTSPMAQPPWAKEPDISASSRRRPMNNPTNLPALPGTTDRRNSPPVSTEGNRLRKLEGRISLSEQSNRALLEEIVRLQGELKNSVRRNEETLRDEKEHRQVLSEKIRAANNLYTQLMMRLARTEEKLDSEHSAVGSLVNHTKHVEQTLMGNQQQLLNRREQVHVRIERIKEDLEDLQDTYEQSQKNMRAMSEDVRNTKSKLEVQTVQFGTMVQELRQRMKKIENDSQSAMDYLRKETDSRGVMEVSTAQLKNTIELRLSEIKETVGELRRRLELEESERRSASQQALLSIEQLKTMIQEVDHKREEDTQNTSMLSRDKESMMMSERSQIANRMAELTEEQNKKLIQKEIRLREEAQSKFLAMEKKFREEQGSRLNFEKALREEIERRWQSLKSYLDEEVQTVKGGGKMSQVKTDQSLVRLNEAISLLERQMEEGRKAVEQVLHAEITSRQSQHEKLASKLTQMQEKLDLAISTLQQAVGGINTRLDEDVKKAKEELKSLIDQSSNTGVKGMADMDSRIGKINKKVIDLEDAIERIDKRIKEPPIIQVTSTGEDNSSKAEENIARWKRETEERFYEVDKKIKPLPDEMNQMQSELKALREGFKALAEEMLRVPTPRQVTPETRVPTPPPPRTATPRTQTPRTPKTKTPVPKSPEPSESDIVEMKERMQKLEDTVSEQNSQVSKLESTVETLRMVLSQKILSEAQTRDDSVNQLKDQLEKIKSIASSNVASAK
ncbi:coiled-coil domain-containing protein 154-like isoform X5 [Actinia tenebrosa]|uniref:Coiled-coil domain-containing protein 154-like isoform X5 n=1 Tax=Actinia tenebrosa TaxID=6105 RepID=A0A6P8IJM3_ACTTE|nr:coiled-coil domain-containing protein 154-like isoform X5 [Actinia tenebrosa]